VGSYVHRQKARCHRSADWSELPGVGEVFAAHPGGRDAGLNDPATRAAAQSALARDYLVNPDLSAVAGLEESDWVVDGDAVLGILPADREARELAAAKAARLEVIRGEAIQYLLDRLPVYTKARDAVEAATDLAAVQAVELEGE